MKVTIRELVETDFPALVVLFREFATFQKMPEKMTNSEPQMLLEKEHINGFVACAEGKIIGYVTYFFAYYTWVGKSLYMDDLYVKPAFRGKGIGSQLINRVVDFGKNNNCQKLRWQVSGWNQPAIDFYKNLGATVDPVESNCDLPLR